MFSPRAALQLAVMCTPNTLYDVYYRSDYYNSNAMKILKIGQELNVVHPDPINYIQGRNTGSRVFSPPAAIQDAVMITEDTSYGRDYRPESCNSNAIKILKIRPELMVEQPDPILYSRKK